jgi:3D (Asp-Asp-Asp) domain-containing protein
MEKKKDKKQLRNAGKGRRKHRIMNRFRRMSRAHVLMLDIGLGCLCVVLLAALLAIPQNVNIKYITLDGFSKDTVATHAIDVRTLLKQMNSSSKYTTDGDDIVKPGRSTSVSDGMDVSILKATFSVARIKGRTVNICLYPGTVKQNLEYNNIEYDDNDRISPSLDTKVTADTKIVVDEVQVKTTQKTVTVKAKDETVMSSKVESGVIKTVDGHDGKAVMQYKTTYVNGKKKKTTSKVKRWKTKVVNNSVIFGTSETGENGTVKYSRTFTGNCTAYYMGESAYGAAGSRCHYGTCAVDPSYIPYGTKLYVTGYGIAVANDCGSAVKNNVVDLYMHNNSEALQWGRQHVKVYVLE